MAKIQGDSKGDQDYLSYLLRLWRVDDQEKVVWRAWLKSAHTGQQVGFASLEEMYEYLQAETGAAQNPMNQ